VSIQPQAEDENDARYNLPLQNYFRSIDSKPNHHHYQTTLLSHPDVEQHRLVVEKAFTGVSTPISQQAAPLRSFRPFECDEVVQDEVLTKGPTTSEDYNLTSHNQNVPTIPPSQCDDKSAPP